MVCVQYSFFADATKCLQTFHVRNIKTHNGADAQWWRVLYGPGTCASSTNMHCTSTPSTWPVSH